ncbi:DUF6221 family protein [Streptomyces sp. NPDC005574]|uniref:DUF6221 family protein n=1 Tax=Streptomyces sp. NPDC005574 TaxID=3156891 RepID=UPI0033A8FB30
MPDLHGWITQQIDEAHQRADRWHDTECDVHATTLIDVTVLQSATLCDCCGPASVLRRCEADRKILAIHAPQDGDWEPHACQGCGTDSEYGVLVDHTNDCETLQALAEGYGLTEEQRATLDRPEPEPRQRRMGGFLMSDAIAESFASFWLGTRPVEPRPEVKALEILGPELKKIAGYVPTPEG